MTTKFSDYGNPIVTLPEKLKALEHCFDNKSYEDALSHVFDLLNYTKNKCRDVFDDFDVEYGDDAWFQQYYGNNPNPIDD